jgi:large repetitive protein
MLKRIGVVALLAACSSQDDVTQVNGPGSPASGATNGPVNSGVGAPAQAAPGSGSTFFWADPSAGASTQSPAAAPAAARPTPATVESAARAILTGPASGNHYSPRQVQQLELRDLHDTGNGAIIASFQRRVSGLPVFGQRVSVAMDRNLGALALSGEVRGDLSSVVPKATGAATASGFQLAPEQAVILAVADVSGVMLARSDVGAAQPASGEYENVALAAPALAKLGAPAGVGPARTRMTLFPGAAKQLLPAYYVETNVGADEEGRPRRFAHVVSAVDGALLWKHDQTNYEAFTYRVYADSTGLYTPWDGPEGNALTPHPGGIPLVGFTPAFVPSRRVTLESLDSVGVTDPWLPDGARETVGNNVDAYLDLSDPDGFTLGTDLRGQISAPGEFDAVFDPVADANATTRQQTAAVTQLFYDVNWFHDWYYAAGFTEVAGNAQVSNYGRGGLEGDPILAEGQDSSGTNNANMFTPADGASPQMQMYLWDVGPSSLTVTGPDAVAGDYDIGQMAFTPAKYDVSGPIVRAEPIDGCAPLVGDYEGAIVLIDRGGGDTCENPTFASKVANAQAAGAAGAIIANVPTSNAPESPPNGGGEPPFPITIGAFGVNLADGDRLRAALAAGESVEARLFRSMGLRDGDVDNQIIAHEWGHYISNRLVLDSAGLNTQMSSGLGEGWGDFHALLMTVRPEDILAPGNESWNGVYGMGGYVTEALSIDSYYFGVRRYPYSTDLSKSPLTFKHISNDAPLPEGAPRAFDSDHTEVHNIGEVWASMLWECYASLLRDTLPPSPRLSFAQARDRMRDYIVAAYKLTPANPTLLEARDALLAAALAYDRTDLQRFSAAFARRGAGVFAIGPDRFDDTNSGIVESYESGAALRATSASLTDDVEPVCGGDGILDSGEIGTLTVSFRNVGNSASATAIATVTASNEAVEFPDGAEITIPPLPINGTGEGTVRVALSGLTEITPIELVVQPPDIGAGLPAAASYGFLTNQDQVPNQSFVDSAESSHVVWSVESSDEAVPADNRWQRQAVSLTEHVYHGGSALLASTVSFESPPLQVRSGVPFVVTFKHRFSFEAAEDAFFDGGVIEISTDDGASWSDVGQDLAGYGGVIVDYTENPLATRSAFVADSAGYPELIDATLDFGTQYAGKSVRLRFVVGSDTGGQSAGWEIDDIGLAGVTAPPFDAVIAHSATCGDSAPSVAPPLVVP